jgi:peroxiredoxin
MKTILRSLTLLSGVCLAGVALALEPGSMVDNFKLFDQNGKPHELSRAAGSKAVAVMIHGNGCPIVRQSVPMLREIRAKYQAQGVEFLLLNSNLQDTRESIASEAQEFSVDFPILVDSKQKVGESLHVVRTAEVFLIDSKTRKLLYRGPIDDRLSYERQRPAEHHYLIDALDATLAGKPVKNAKVDGVGCLVNFPDRDSKT